MVRSWPQHASSVRVARDELRKVLADWGLGTIEDAATLVLSELLTNAMVHTQMPRDWKIVTQFAPRVNGVRIAVDDVGSARPKASDADEEGGFGLLLVNQYSDDWGVTDRNRAGKSVWAVLTAGEGRA